MKEQDKSLEAIQDIRKMMVQSSKFISLSGLSGILAGIYALIGVAAGIQVISRYMLLDPDFVSGRKVDAHTIILYLGLICVGVLFLSLLSAYLLSKQKAKKQGVKLFDHTSKKLAYSMLVPLVTGGVVCMAFLYHQGSYLFLICPTMLIFYGIALIQSDRYVLHEVRWLGYTELLLGFLALFYLGNGLLFWSLGFGIMHILYGGVMWIKYDMKT